MSSHTNLKSDFLQRGPGSGARTSPWTGAPPSSHCPSGPKGGTSAFLSNVVLQKLTFFQNLSISLFDAMT